MTCELLLSHVSGLCKLAKVPMIFTWLIALPGGREVPQVRPQRSLPSMLLVPPPILTYHLATTDLLILIPSRQLSFEEQIKDKRKNVDEVFKFGTKAILVVIRINTTKLKFIYFLANFMLPSFIFCKLHTHYYSSLYRPY